MEVVYLLAACSSLLVVGKLGCNPRSCPRCNPAVCNPRCNPCWCNPKLPPGVAQGVARSCRPCPSLPAWLVVVGPSSTSCCKPAANLLRSSSFQASFFLLVLHTNTLSRSLVGRTHHHHQGKAMVKWRKPMQASFSSSSRSSSMIPTFLLSRDNLAQN